MGAVAAARAKDYDRAKDLWLKALERRPDDAAAHLALAKHFEHREKDFSHALLHASRTAEAEGEEGSAHRIKRLERRLSKTR
jgi:Tfp pilus assembly protein PilF